MYVRICLGTKVLIQIKCMLKNCPVLGRNFKILQKH